MQRLAIREGWATVILSALHRLHRRAVDSARRLGGWARDSDRRNGRRACFPVSLYRSGGSLPSAVLHLGGFLVGLLAVVFAMTRYLDDSIGDTRESCAGYGSGARNG